MQFSKVLLASTAFLSVGSAAQAGMSSTPFISPNDINLDGTPLPQAECPDGWVFTNSNLCKPLNGKDFEVEKPEATQNNNQNNNQTQANTQQNTTNVKTTNSTRTVNLSVSQDNTTTFFNGSKLPSTSLNLYTNSDLESNSEIGINLYVPLGTNKKRVIEGLKVSQDALLADSCSKLAMANLTNDECSANFRTLVDYSQLAPVVDNAQELADAKQAIKEALESAKELQRINEALQQRIIQMQNAAPNLPIGG